MAMRFKVAASMRADYSSIVLSFSVARAALKGFAATLFPGAGKRRQNGFGQRLR